MHSFFMTSLITQGIQLHEVIFLRHTSNVVALGCSNGREGAFIHRYQFFDQ